jgi:hypothetical protein
MITVCGIGSDEVTYVWFGLAEPNQLVLPYRRCICCFSLLNLNHAYLSFIRSNIKYVIATLGALINVSRIPVLLYALQTFSVTGTAARLCFFLIINILYLLLVSFIFGWTVRTFLRRFMHQPTLSILLCINCTKLWVCLSLTNAFKEINSWRFQGFELEKQTFITAYHYLPYLY